MSDIAMQYYKTLAAKGTGPDGKPLSDTQLRVMSQLCYLHHQAVWCAWPRVSLIAEKSRLSEVHCRRVIAELEDRKLVRRWGVVSERGRGAQVSSEYELPDLLRWLVREGRLRPDQVRPLLRKKRSQINRDTNFTEVRVRQAARLEQRGGGRAAVQGRCAVSQELWGASAEPSGDQGVLKVTAGGRSTVPSSAEAVQDVVQTPLFSAPMIVPPDRNDCPPQSKRLPSSSRKEITEWNKKNPLTPITAVDGGNRKDGWSGRGASSVSGKVLTFSAAHGEEQWLREREQLDGIDAALYDEMIETLEACGTPRALSNRRLRRDVLEALRFYCDTHESTPAQAGFFGRAMWSTFVAATPYLLQAGKPDLRRFFAGGYWHDVRRWPWIASELRRARWEPSGDDRDDDVYLVLPRPRREGSARVLLGSKAIL